MRKMMLVFSAMLVTLLFFIPMDNIFFEYVSFYLNAIRLLILIFLASVLALVYSKSHGKIKGLLKKVSYVSLFVIVTVCSLDSVNSYSSYVSERYSSVLSESYVIEEKYKQFLPFYDLFYEINGENAYYAVALDSTKTLKGLYISNRPYELKANSSSYVTECYTSNSFLLMSKLKLDEFINISKNKYVLCDEFFIEDSNENIVKIYSNSFGYIACIYTNQMIATIEAEYIFDIDLDCFRQIVKSQFLNLKDWS